MSIVKRVRQVVSTESRNEQSRATEYGSTRLYRCDSCDVTYISEEMDTCSRCDGSVESVPTERDLGL